MTYVPHRPALCPHAPHPPSGNRVSATQAPPSNRGRVGHHIEIDRHRPRAPQWRPVDTDGSGCARIGGTLRGGAGQRLRRHGRRFLVLSRHRSGHPWAGRRSSPDRSGCGGRPVAIGWFGRRPRHAKRPPSFPKAAVDIGVWSICLSDPRTRSIGHPGRAPPIERKRDRGD